MKNSQEITYSTFAALPETNLSTSIANDNVELKTKIALLIQENERLRINSQRINEADAKIAVLADECKKQALVFNEKSRECEMWKNKYAEADKAAHDHGVRGSVMNKEKEQLCREQGLALEQLAQFENLKVQYSHLSMDYSSLNQTKEKLVNMLNERDQQNAALNVRLNVIDQQKAIIAVHEQEKAALAVSLANREQSVADCNAKICQLESQLKEQRNNGGDLSGKLSSVNSENDRLTAVVAERFKEIESLKVTISKLSEVEKTLTIVTLERDNLKVALAEREQTVHNMTQERAGLMDSLSKSYGECEQLKERVKSLEDQNSVIPSLKERCTQLAGELENKNATCVLQATEIQKLTAQITQLGNVETQLTLMLVEKDRLRTEREKLNTCISEQKEELSKLRLRAQQADELDVHVANQSSEKDGLHEVVIEKSRENEALKAKNAVIPHLEQKILISQQNSLTLSNMIKEKEQSIAELTTRTNSLEVQLCDYESVKQKITVISSENQKLAVSVGEKLKEIDSLKFRIAQLNEVEASLAATAAEKSKLATTLNEKMHEIESLKVALQEARAWEPRYKSVVAERDNLITLLDEKIRLIETMKAEIAVLEVEVHKVPDLQNKLAYMISENERLNLLVIEKIRIIEDWQVRYASLEYLYANIKETTDQLDFIKRKFETAVVQSEAFDPKLRQNMELRKSCELRKSAVILNSNVNMNATVPLSPLGVGGMKTSQNLNATAPISPLKYSSTFSHNSDANTDASPRVTVLKKAVVQYS